MAIVINGSGTITGLSNDSLSGNLVDGGTVSAFASIGIDDNADATAITIDSSERVGVGTTSPVADLDILGAAGSHNGNLKFTEVAGDVSTTRLSLMPYGTDNTAISFDAYLNDAETAWVSSDAGSNFQIKKTGDKLSINCDSGIAVDSAISWTTAMTINNSGNVGIGTSTPTSAVGFDRFLTIVGTNPALGLKGGGHWEMSSLSNGTLRFTKDDVDKMLVDSGGHLFVGATANGSFHSPARGVFWETSTNNHALLAYGSSASFNESGGGLVPIGTAKSASPYFAFSGMYSGGFSDKEFSFRGDGNGYCDGSWNGGGADYAEFFEWSDGNPDNEDRRGISVVLESEKIRPAVDGEDPFGVISGRPAVVGDTDIGKWKQKHLRDDFGTYVLEPYTVTEWEAEEVDEPATEDTPATYKTVQHSYESDKIPEGITVPDYAVVSSEDGEGTPFERRKLNPEWNESLDYISREDRPEWDTVGLMGKIRIRIGQPTGSRWIKMRDVSDNVQEWLVR